MRWLESGIVFSSPEHEGVWFIRVACNICTDISRERIRHAAIPLEECEYLTGINDAEDAAASCVM